MTVKIAFFDIDETIYDYRTKSFAPDAIESIKELQSTGVKVCLCSSRPNDSIKYLGCHDQGIVWDAGVVEELQKLARNMLGVS